MSLEKRDVESSLQTKGFIKSNDRDHNFFTYFTATGKKSRVYTKTSHGANCTLGDPLVALMAKQCRVTKGKFVDLIRCPLSREEYEKLLSDQQLIF